LKGNSGTVGIVSQNSAKAEIVIANENHSHYSTVHDDCYGLVMNHSVKCAAGSAPGIRTSALSQGSALFVWSAREWAYAARSRQCVMRALISRYQGLGCMQAIQLIDECMMLLAAAAFRPVCIHNPQDSEISRDEYSLVLVLQALQRNQPDVAQAELSPLIAGRLNHTFRRAAADYVEVLRAAELSCVGVRALNLVAIG